MSTVTRCDASSDAVAALDASAVHPEAYPVVEKIRAQTGRSVRELIGDGATLRTLDAAKFVDERFGLPTVRDILRELEVLVDAYLASLETQSATVEGVRQNQLIGYGLVVGLDGSGDQTTQTPFTTQSLGTMLQNLGITLPPGVNPALKNAAAVMVTASKL